MLSCLKHESSSQRRQDHCSFGSALTKQAGVLVTGLALKYVTIGLFSLRHAYIENWILPGGLIILSSHIRSFVTPTRPELTLLKG